MAVSNQNLPGFTPFHLKGGGSCGDLFRSIDWDKHPLGPCDLWPSALKTALLILFHSQHPMFIWWGHELFQFYNDAYLPSFGIGKHPTAMGQRGRECWPEIWPTIGPQIESVMNEGASTWNVDQLVPIFRNGKLDEVYWTYGYSPIFLNSDQVGGTLVVCMETTERILSERAAKRAHEAERESAQNIQEFFMQAPLPMAILEGPEYLFSLANRHYEEFIGRPANGKTIAEVFRQEEVALFIPLLDSVLQTGIPFEGKEMPFNFADSQGEMIQRWIDIGYYPFRRSDAVIKGVLAIVQDMTPTVLARQALEVAKAEAELAKDEAERASQTKSAFLANMSHEIRTPLGAILGFADLLKDRGIDWKEREHFLETICRNGKALTRIIDDILDLAKVESGKLEVEEIEFSLLELLNDVLDLFRERSKSKGIFIQMNLVEAMPARICSDPTRLRQILINIVGNAVKFTKEGGVTIDVAVSHSEMARCSFEISVQDSGIGISSEQRSRLFQPFTQADNTTTRKYGGTGLGLVLSDRLARALGGQIRIRDCGTSKGCTFVFDFRATVPHASNLNLAGESRSLVLDSSKRPLQNVKILLADDSIDNQFLARRILAKNGALVDSANNGFEAFRMALKGCYDIVLMDIQMPSMDGYAATRALREAGFNKPIIALTAHAMAEERARSFAAGCDGHLTKPLDQVELVGTILRQMQQPMSESLRSNVIYDA